MDTHSVVTSLINCLASVAKVCFSFIFTYVCSPASFFEQQQLPASERLAIIEREMIELEKRITEKSRKVHPLQNLFLVAGHLIATFILYSFVGFLKFMVIFVLIFTVEYSFFWAYNKFNQRTIPSDRLRFSDLQLEKAQILERVKQTETYYVANELLRRYGNYRDNRYSPQTMNSNEFRRQASIEPRNVSVPNRNERRQISSQLMTPVPLPQNASIMRVETRFQTIEDIGSGARFGNHQIRSDYLVDSSRNALRKKMKQLTYDNEYPKAQNFNNNFRKWQ